MSTRSLTPVRVRGRLRREEDDHAREQKLEISDASAAAKKLRQEAHVSVLLQETVASLGENRTNILDATAGEGGHSEALLKAYPRAHLIALDADPSSVEKTRARLERFGSRAQVIEANFGDAGEVLARRSIEPIDAAVFDLGWNSGQLSSGRGFSFLVDEPLLMSYGKKPASGFFAKDILNEWDEETLANVFYGYGEERYARRIAKAVVARRDVQPIESTMELVEIVRDSTPAAYRHGRIHPATRVFQALRIAVNDELGAIERGIDGVWKHLASGGRVAVITFHSIEDRKVKQLFAERAKKDGTLIVKKPIVPSKQELAENPRARSAKLRVIEKI